jgi:hypothetical protein
MNPRIYEALACGALVVSEWREEIGQGVPTLPTFRNLDEAVALVGHLLLDPIACEQRQNECFAALSGDTYSDPLRKALEIVSRTSPSQRSRDERTFVQPPNRCRRTL